MFELLNTIIEIGKKPFKVIGIGWDGEKEFAVLQDPEDPGKTYEADPESLKPKSEQ